MENYERTNQSPKANNKYFRRRREIIIIKREISYMPTKKYHSFTYFSTWRSVLKSMSLARRNLLLGKLARSPSPPTLLWTVRNSEVMNQWTLSDQNTSFVLNRIIIILIIMIRITATTIVFSLMESGRMRDSVKEVLAGKRKAGMV